MKKIPIEPGRMPKLGKRRRGRPCIMPFRDLAVGQGFFRAGVNQRHLTSACVRWRKQLEKEGKARIFRTEAGWKNGKKGVYVWRTK